MLLVEPQVDVDGGGWATARLMACCTPLRIAGTSSWAVNKQMPPPNSCCIDIIDIAQCLMGHPACSLPCPFILQPAPHINCQTASQSLMITLASPCANGPMCKRSVCKKKSCQGQQTGTHRTAKAAIFKVSHTTQLSSPACQVQVCSCKRIIWKGD